jgi:3-oxoadipate enol-lactonase
MTENQRDVWPGTVDVGDCLIHVAIDEPLKAPYLMLSNSLGSDLTMWNLQLAAFSESFCVIRYDSRGHGKSEAPQGPYSMERLGLDAVSVLDHLGIAKTNWCGLSMGGMVGQWLGARFDTRIDRLILSNTTCYYAEKLAWTDRIDFVRSQGLAAIAGPTMERWFSKAFRERRGGEIARATEMLLKTSLDGYVGCCAAIRDMDHRALLSKIKAPTLIIAGLLDAATPVDRHEFIRSQIASAGLVILEAAHLSNREQPDAYTDTVLQFLLN